MSPAIIQSLHFSIYCHEY